MTREAIGGKRVMARRPYDEAHPDGYLESDRDFLANNNDVAVALLESLSNGEDR